MLVEVEFPSLLTIGFTIVLLIFALSTITLWVKNRKNGVAYAFILLHLLLLSISFYFFTNAFNFEINQYHPMASEENSAQIGMASIFWAISMISLLIAIFQFTSYTKNR